jgi:hypothetical protein
MAAMRALGFVAPLAAGLLVATVAPAQDTRSDDDVFDNTKLNEQLAQERAEQRREKYQGDSPFAADEQPDKVEKREQRFRPGMQGGYRAGWAIPTGNIWKGSRFTQNLTGMIFLWGDGGYRPIPELMLGMYLGAGYVVPDCAGDTSCTAWDFRAGLQGQWRFMPFADFTPWIGVGAGWELYLLSSQRQLGESSLTLHGPELFHIQAGIDVWAPTARGHAGLFVAYSMGRFISASLSTDGEDIPVDLEPDNHNWIFIGARGTF